MEQKGFEIVEQGGWDDIADFCGTLSDILEDRISEESYERFETWRPRTEETDRTLRKKTAEDEAIQETGIEKNSESTAKELSTAGGNVKKGGKNMVHGNPKETIKDMEHAGNAAAKGFVPPILRLIRNIEELLYTNIIGKTNPHYFECSELTISIEHKLLHNGTYTIHVNAEDASLQDTIEHRLREENNGDTVHEDQSGKH